MKIFTSLKKFIIFLLITTVCINIFSSETNGFFTQNIEENQNIETNNTDQTTQEGSNNKPVLHSLQKSIIPHNQKHISIPENIITQYTISYKTNRIVFEYFHDYAYTYADLVGIIKIVI